MLVTALLWYTVCCLPAQHPDQVDNKAEIDTAMTGITNFLVKIGFAGWDFMGHLGFALEASSFLFTDIIHLRLCYITANTLLVLYAVLSLGWVEGTTVLMWSAALVFVNIVQLGRFWWNQYATLSEDEEMLWKKCFGNMSQSEFRVLYKKGTLVTLGAGKSILKEGDKVTDLIVILSGECSVNLKNMRIATLRNYAFIGDLGVLTNEESAATVVTTKPTRFMKWSRMTLEGLSKRDPRMQVQLISTLGNQAATKLKLNAGKKADLAKIIANHDAETERSFKGPAAETTPLI